MLALQRDFVMEHRSEGSRSKTLTIDRSSNATCHYAHDEDRVVIPARASDITAKRIWFDLAAYQNSVYASIQKKARITACRGTMRGSSGGKVCWTWQFAMIQRGKRDSRKSRPEDRERKTPNYSFPTLTLRSIDWILSATHLIAPVCILVELVAGVLQVESVSERERVYDQREIG